MNHYATELPKKLSNSDEIFLKTVVSTGILAGHCAYALLTEQKDAIFVVKKYKINRNGFTDFMLIDDKGRHFNVNNSYWYWKWDSIEDWHKINEKSEEKLFIKYYGWRVPFLGLFPNIVLSDKVKFLNSMTSSEFRNFEFDKVNN
jgi:hypothetical protein